jgi:hypothetical protein
MFLFYVLSFFKKRGHYSWGTLFKGDIIQGNVVDIWDVDLKA